MRWFLGLGLGVRGGSIHIRIVHSSVCQPFDSISGTVPAGKLLSYPPILIACGSIHPYRASGEVVNGGRILHSLTDTLVDRFIEEQPIHYPRAFSPRCSWRRWPQSSRDARR